MLLSSGITIADVNEKVVVLPKMKVSADSWLIEYDVDSSGMVKIAFFSEVFPKTSLWNYGVRQGDLILKLDNMAISTFTGKAFEEFMGPGLRVGGTKVLTIKSGHRNIFFRKPEYTLPITPVAPKPNQPLQTTPTAVTPAAGAPGAPAAGVPEL